MTARLLSDLAAPAKLNLFLHVVGRRPDGYHLLESVFVLIDWADTLHLERRDDGRLQRHDLNVALPADDLCLRAARALQAASGTRYGVDISIEKQLPWGAGLGGGSSDAATVLLGLNRLWDLHWPRARLLALAVQIGADVPFFVGGRNAVVGGIGERLAPIDWPPAWYAVAKPAQSLETRAIFSHPELAFSKEADIVMGFLGHASRASQASQEAPDPTPAAATPIPHAGADWVDWVNDQARNDLQPPAERLAPDVAQVVRWMQQRFGNSRMTGSGSAVFSRAGTDDRPSANLPAALPAGWVGRMCRGLEQHPLVGWAPD